MEETIHLTDSGEAKLFFGERDNNLRLLRDALSVNIVARDTFIKISGEEADVKVAGGIVSSVLSELRSDGSPLAQKVKESLQEKLRVVFMADAGAGSTRRRDNRSKCNRENVQYPQREGHLANPGSGADYLLVPLRSAGQERYVQAIKDKTVVFCIGPAGTGKTYLAVMMAISMLRAGVVEKIVLVRPAVEAGEKLGFLPGDFQAKISPYLRPLYDALYDLLDVETVRRYREKDLIEIVPLAYMRGRTLNRSFMILDEAQNTTSVQMKMFLTRLGMESRAVVTGDITQIDIPRRNQSGLIQVQKILKSVKGAEFIYMHKKDIVRHPIIEKILAAYERAGK